MARKPITITEIANMKSRVTFQVPQLISDDQGGNENTWVDIAEVPEVWCFLRPVNSRERLFSQEIQYQRTHIAIIRFRTDLSNDMRIKYNNRFFQVKGFYDPEERHEYLVIDLEENQGT